MEDKEREHRVAMRAAQDPRVASDAWVRNLEERYPGLVGQLGRPPTRDERMNWAVKSEERKDELIAAKMRFQRSGFKEHMIRYLTIRMECGYVEGVEIPRWLWRTGT